MLPSTRTMSSQLLYRDSNKHTKYKNYIDNVVDRFLSNKQNVLKKIIYRERHTERPREYIDVPLPQSVLNYNLDHETNCLRYNQIHPQ